jgi:metallo-beta-lactamase family protein
VYTIGGLSAHADQQDLVDWYSAFGNRPPVYLIHGERRAQEPLARRLKEELGAPVEIADYAQIVDI